MKTKFRQFQPIVVLFISFLSFAACSDKDAPTPEISDNKDMTTSEDFGEKEYQEKLAGSLWVTSSYKWVDEEGNVVSSDAELYGGMGISRFLYTGYDCIVEFYSNDTEKNFSVKLSGTIDPQTGLLGRDYTASTNMYFDSVDDDNLIIRTKYGQLSENGQLRDDVYLQVTYKHLPAGFTSELFSLYSPSNFHPEELNLPPVPDKITKGLFEAVTEGYVWRSRGEAQWQDEEGITIDSGAKFGVQRHGFLYIGKGFYLYPEKDKSYLVKGSFDEATCALAPMPDNETQNTIYIDRLSADKLYVHSGKGLFKENGVVRNDVSYHYDYFLYPMTLKEFIEMYPPGNYTLSEIDL